MKKALINLPINKILHVVAPADIYLDPYPDANLAWRDVSDDTTERDSYVNDAVVKEYVPPELTSDERAALAADRIDRLQFDVLFTAENNVRALRTIINTLVPGSFTTAQAAQITRAQYRDALIARWKVLNP